MQLIVPLPAQLSVSDAARIARAVSVAIERECGFVVEARLETCEHSADAKPGN